MRRLLLLVILLCISTITFAKNGKIFCEITYPKNLIDNEKYEDKENNVEFNFTASGDGTINFHLYNSSDKRVYIEWENAKFQGSRVVFGDDTRLTMGRAKADEVVMSYSFSEFRTIYPQRYVLNDYIMPLYDSSELRKDGTKAYCTVIIPIRFENGKIIDYKISFNVFYKSIVDYSGLRIGMKKGEVKVIMDKPDQITQEGSQLIWIYTNNVRLIFESNKLVDIQPYSE